MEGRIGIAESFPIYREGVSGKLEPPGKSGDSF